MAESPKQNLTHEEIARITRDAYKQFIEKLFPIVRSDWWVYVFTPFSLMRINYREHDDYKKSLEFKKTFEPEGGEEYDYKWIHQYACDSYERLQKQFDSLDNKADATIKYLGGATALVSVGSLFTVTPESYVLLDLLTLPAAFAVLSIITAMMARGPMEVPTPPPIETATRYVAYFAGRSESVFLGLWHACCEGLAVKIEEKARFVKISGRFLIATLVLMFLLLPTWPLIRGRITPSPAKPTLIQLVQPEMDKP
jgi:hypothetical protein